MSRPKIEVCDWADAAQIDLDTSKSFNIIIL